MSKFKILHLYHDLMNLYGDWANVAILDRALEVMGHSVTVDKKSVGDKIIFKEYDFAYIGSGTERSQQMCIQDLLHHCDALADEINEGMFMLATGNSHELFGRSITTAGGKRYDALGILDFKTVQKNTRVTGDCVYTASFLPNAKLIGFVNRAGGGQQQNKTMARPFSVKSGPGSSDDGTRSEGIRHKNILGTYLTGPVLVRNPVLLKYCISIITGRAAPKNLSKAANSSPSDALLFNSQEKAYRAAVKELSRNL